MISVIIPVLNDAKGLRRTLLSLVADKEGHEVIVADGGSIDGGLELAQSFEWVKVLRGVPARAARLNEAVLAAQGDLLLFLPPGTTLERGWPRAAEEAAADPTFALGSFRLQMDAPGLPYRMVEAFAWVRSSLLRFPRGNQGLFIKRAGVVDGRAFTDLPGGEDLDLVRRMRQSGKVVQAKASAVNVVERWDVGSPLRRVTQDLRALAGLFRGAQPQELARFGDGEGLALAMFVKEPEPGLVKKRLIDLLGEERAARLYRRNVEEILHTARTAPVHARVYVFFTPPEAQSDMQRWLGEACMLIAQQGENDRERRAQAFDALFRLGVERIVLLGPHCPALQRGHVVRACNALQTHEAVLGPTDDGGCYLVGFTRKQRDLMVDLEWEPDRVFAELCAKLSSAGASFLCLETLKDLDTAADVPMNWAMGLVQE